MPAFDTTELTKVIREVLDPRVRDLFNRSAILWNLVNEGTAKETNPRGVRIVGLARPNVSMLWFGEGGKYPSGGRRSFVSMTVLYRRYAIASRMTRDTLENSAEAIISLVKDDVRDNTKQAMVELNQQGYRDGSAVKGVVSASVSGANGTITFALPFRARQIFVEGVYNVYAGSVHDGFAIGDKIGTGVMTCLSKTDSTGVAVFDSVPVNVVAGDVVTWEGSFGRAIHGLDYIVSNATTDYFGIDRSLFPQYRSIVDSSGGDLSIAKLNKVLFQIKYLKGADSHSSRVDNLMIVSAPTQANRYVNLGDPTAAGTATSIRRNTSFKDPLDLGYKTYEFQGIRWVEDTDCPDDVLYMLNRASLNKFNYKELGIVSMVGTENGIAPIPGFDANGVGSYFDSGLYVMTWKGDLASPDPGQNIKFTNLGTSGLAVGYNIN
jgi:hypothetical protein